MEAGVSQGLVELEGAPSASRERFDSESARLLSRVSRRCTVALFLANGLGAAIVFLLGVFVIPAPKIANGQHLELLNLIVFAAGLPAGLVVGLMWSFRVGERAFSWIREERVPTPKERDAALRHPLDQAAIEGTLWLAAAVAFVLINAPYSLTLAVESAIEIVLGGLTTCAITYLITERITQPLRSLALQAAPPEAPTAPGVACRMISAWAYGSAVPLLGLGLLGVALLAHLPETHVSTGLAVLALAAVGLVAGFVVVWITSRTLSDPLRSLREALARVERGELDTVLPVDDASEMGHVQAGFNRMVRGLKERERLHDLFGRHVGKEVAQDALERHDVELGGETREAAVVFIDLIGSTSLASTREPADVVAELNAFFAIVVDCVSLHGGWVNKFEGDAALCIFGAPTAHPDAAGSALATARVLSKRIEREITGLEAGIGVSAGTVVAGNVGAAERFEYTVIGDPVNEAARLSELAKGDLGRVLASEAALDGASAPERSRWAALDSVSLRGRSAPTTIAVPRQGPLPLGQADGVVSSATG